MNGAQERVRRKSANQLKGKAKSGVARKVRARSVPLTAKENFQDRPYLSIYEGRDLLGVIVEGGQAVEAFDRHGVPLGSFPKREGAVSAVYLSLPVAHVRDQRGDQTE